MSKRGLVALVALCGWAHQAFADTYYRNKTEYGVSTLAKDYFGPESTYERSPGIDFGTIQFDAATKLDCGRIDLVTNFEGQFKKIREQAKAFVQNLDQYVAAAPMLAICYAAPQVCALLRHDHFQFAQNLNLRAQACAAIDRYIDNQADKGAKQLAAEATRNCVDSELQNGSDMASATETCQGKSGMPLRDLSSGIQKKFRQGPQRVLASILGDVGEAPAYPMLASLLGEIEIQTDGYWQPLWPHRMLKPYEVVDNTLQEAVAATCGNLSGMLTSSSGANNEVRAILRAKLTREDAENLLDLTVADRKVACTALGRSVSVLILQRSVAKKEAIMASALTNAALTEGLREEYRKRSQNAFEALRAAAESEQVPELENIRGYIRELASAERAYNRFTAARISGAKQRNTMSRSQTDCADTLSCQ